MSLPNCFFFFFNPLQELQLSTSLVLDAVDVRLNLAFSPFFPSFFVRPSMCSHTHSSVSPPRERVSGFCSILRFTSFSSETVSVKVNNRNTFYGLITDLVPQLFKQTTKESNRLLKYFPTKSDPNDRSSRCGCHSSIIHKQKATPMRSLITDSTSCLNEEIYWGRCFSIHT